MLLEENLRLLQMPALVAEQPNKRILVIHFHGPPQVKSGKNEAGNDGMVSFFQAGAPGRAPNKLTSPSRRAKMKSAERIFRLEYHRTLSGCVRSTGSVHKEADAWVAPIAPLSGRRSRKRMEERFLFTR